MTMVVEKLGERARWWCRLLSETLSLLAMALLAIGCWRQTVINIDNHAPITGAPLAIVCIAGLCCGVAIGLLNLINLWRLSTSGAFR